MKSNLRKLYLECNISLYNLHSTCDISVILQKAEKDEIQ